MQDLKKKIRTSKYQTQERFAMITGIHESLISKYCRGMRKPSKNHAEIIKRFLKKDGSIKWQKE